MDLFVARQPIFDLRRFVAGYELLYRRSGDQDSSLDPSPDTRSGRLMVNAVLGVGLDRLARGLPAYVNVDESMLLDPGALELLDPRKVVLEILETTSATREVIARCGDLAAKGYRIALDDFEYHPAFDPLLEIASLVKVDLRATSAKELPGLVEHLRRFDVELLAEKVETPIEHELCVELGFTLFQGFLYLPPEIFKERDLPVKTLRLVQVLNLLRDMNAADREIGELFRSDPGLSYKLLRIVNSASLGGRGVQSIEHALRLIGRDQLHQWLVLLLLSTRSGDGQLRELAWSALLRGRFCELAEARATRLDGGAPAGPGAAFLAGMFSRMDTLLGIEMSEVLTRVDLTDEVRDALIDRGGRVGALLGGVIAYEEGRWSDAEFAMQAAGVSGSDLSTCYMDAVGWAEGTIAMGARAQGADRTG